ncbi:NUDIX domain-containing protein [Candidatus Roizmanbacteria bacterium]|nr:NUDIX domain-containing protein [Candidatus Roizmanbacteria bacterium]
MKFKTETSAGGIVFKEVKSQKSKVKSYFWLITQHSKHKGWGFPKGLIGDKESTESMEQAAIREVEEEGGVKAKIISKKPFGVKYKYRFGEYLVDKTVYYFLMEYISGDPKDHDWEMMDAKFVSEDEAKKTLTFKSDQEAFEKALKLLEEK